MVYVHYNGLDTSEDEWISISSNRISPFRCKTVNSLNSKYLSPNPKIPATYRLDNELQHPNVLYELLYEVGNQIDKIGQTLLKLAEEKTKNFTCKTQNQNYTLNASTINGMLE